MVKWQTHHLHSGLDSLSCKPVISKSKAPSVNGLAGISDDTGSKPQLAPDAGSRCKIRCSHLLTRSDLLRRGLDAIWPNESMISASSCAIHASKSGPFSGLIESLLDLSIIGFENYVRLTDDDFGGSTRIEPAFMLHDIHHLVIAGTLPQEALELLNCFRSIFLNERINLTGNVLGRALDLNQLKDCVVHDAFLHLHKATRLAWRCIAVDITQVNARSGVSPDSNRHGIGVELFQQSNHRLWVRRSELRPVLPMADCADDVVLEADESPYQSVVQTGARFGCNVQNKTPLPEARSSVAQG